MQYVMMMIDLQKELSHDLKKSVCVASLPQSNWNKPIKNYTCESYKVTALEINIVYRNVSILYIQYINTLQVHISTSGIFIHCVG